MDDFRVYIRKYRKDDAGEYVPLLPEDELGDVLPGVVYKAMTNVSVFGKPRVYTETFAEKSGVDVYIPDEGFYDTVEHTLSLYVFGGRLTNAGGVVGATGALLDESAQRSGMYRNLRGLRELFSGHFTFRDTARDALLMLYCSSAPSVKTEKLDGIPYLQVDFKLTNVFGRPFYPEDDVPFET